MIRFFAETPFKIDDKQKLKQWIKLVVSNENKKIGDINFIFCDDEYLLAINQQYLKHDYYTDVISFDNSFNNTISGEIYISINTVKDNAQNRSIDFTAELRRVIIHGVLHFLGYKDKAKSESKQMRAKEDYYLSLFRKEKY